MAEKTNLNPGCQYNISFKLTMERSISPYRSPSDKSGDQRGPPAKEDIMDTVISLKRPKGYAMQEGARFEVHLTKASEVAGKEVKPFETQLIENSNALIMEKAAH